MCRQVEQLSQCASVVPDTWTLIWCYKQCFHAEWQNFRRAMKAAMANQGIFLCLRNAQRLERLLGEQASPSPSVLLTDWREAKPCWDVLAEHGCRPSQVLLVVYTEGPKQFTTAKKWAAELPRRNMVHVIPCLGSPDDLIEQLQCFRKDTASFQDTVLQPSSGQQLALNGEEASDQSGTVFGTASSIKVAAEASFTSVEAWKWSDEASDQGGTAFGMASSIEVAAEASFTAMEAWKWSDEVSDQGSTDFSTASPIGAAAEACFTAMEAWKWSSPVAQRMLAALPSQSTSEVVGLLQAAAPSMYED